MVVIKNNDSGVEVSAPRCSGGDGTVETRFDNMKAILLDMYWMGIDARASHVSGIVSDMNDLGYEVWDGVPQKVQARLMYDNYRFEN